MKIKPTFNNILVRIRGLDPTPGIYLPETSTPIHPYGEVIACGPECKTTKVGDRALFIPSSGMGFTQDKEDVYILSEGAVLGYYVDEAELTLN